MAFQAELLLQSINLPVIIPIISIFIWVRHSLNISSLALTYSIFNSPGSMAAMLWSSCCREFEYLWFVISMVL